MKNMLFLFHMLAMAQLAFSQPNHYLEHHPVWQVSKVCAVPYPCIRHEFVNYLVGSDTTISGMVYKKIFENSQGYFSWQSSPPAGCSGTFSSVDSVPSYYMRSEGKQMFIRLPADTGEMLLYDFNLSIGQALPITYNNFSGDILVTAIDSIYTPYGYRKTFQLNGFASAQYLLEGMGSSNGLIEYIPLMLECGYYLLCFSYNDTSYYPSAGIACNLMVGQPTEEEGQPFDVSPNPFTGHTTLYAPYHLRNATLSIWNGQGKLVHEQHKINGSRCEIQGNNLVPGIYLVKLMNEGKAVGCQRLVIVE